MQKGSNSNQIWMEKAVEFHQKGQLKEAEALYKQILEVEPRNSDALHLMGCLLGSVKEIKLGITYIEKAISIRPDIPLFYINLASIYNEIGDYRKAETICDKVLGMEAKSNEAIRQKGIAQFKLGKVKDALRSFSQVLQLTPENSHAYCDLGNALEASGDRDQARKAFERALELNPQNTAALNNLGLLHFQEYRSKEAEELLQYAVTIDPNLCEAWENLAGVLQNLGKTNQAREALKRALKLKPDDPICHIREASVCPVIVQGNRALSAWRKRFKKAITQFPEVDLERYGERLAKSYLEPPYHLVYQGVSNRDLKAEYAKIFKISSMRPVTQSNNSLQIAFLVTSGHESIFLQCTKGIVDNWNVDEAQLTIIGNNIRILQRELQRADVRYLQIPGHILEASRLVKSGGFDLVYFWEVGSDSLNYFLPFWRVAPVQCTSWGTPETTGLPDMDYYLSCRHWEVPGSEALYSEELVVLNRPPVCYKRPELDAEIKPLESWGLDPQKRLYACVQNLFKLHPNFDVMIADLLHRDRDGVLVLVEGKYPHWTDLLKMRLKQTLQDHFDRVQFIPRLNYQEYLSVIKQVDVLIDSFHFSGGNTTYEGLAMGTPIVTWPGQFARGRFSLGAYRQMGIEDCIARDRDHCVELALKLAMDSSFRAQISEKISSRWSSIFDDVDAAREFQGALVALITR